MTKGRKKVSSSSAPREFNITGSIIPEEHYYVDLKATLKKLMALVEKRKYFVISRPRQFGKTTTLNFLAQRLQAGGEYAPALISFAHFVQRPKITEAEFYSETSRFIAKELKFLSGGATEIVAEVNRRPDFFEWLREICKNRKLVLLIAEVDAAPETVERAIQELLAMPNPNFDSLFKNARHPNLLPIVLDLLEAKPRRNNIQNDAIRLGVEHGIFAAKDRQLILANLIYVQVLYQNFEKELEEFDMSGLVADIRIQD